VDAAIAGYDSYRALGQLGDLVLTGPTGTNVSDLWTIVIGAPGRGDGKEGAP
jgi:glycerate-2-kinase